MRLGLVLFTFATAIAAQELTLETAFSRPEGPVPTDYAFSGDGQRLAYLLRDELVVLDLSTGDRRVVDRKVRQFRWRPGTHELLREGANGWKLGDRTLLKNRRPRALRWAPDGQRFAFVEEGDLWVYELEKHAARQVTRRAGPGRRCGLPEYMAVEELDRNEGYWWAPDSRRIAYQFVDGTRVPRFFIPNLLHKRNLPRPQEYPRAGNPNVAWELRLVDVESGADEKLPIADEYLVRVDWSPRGELWVQTSNRLQTKLTVRRDGEVVREETDDKWVAFHDDLRLLDDGRWLWSTEESGWRHLLLNGEPLTSGEWGVDRVVHADRARVFFLASRTKHHERRLYSVDYATKKLRDWTPKPGWHDARLSPDGAWILQRSSRVTQTPHWTLRHTQRDEFHQIAGGRRLPGLQAPEFLDIPQPAMLFRAKKRGPAIIYVYAGPDSQIVRDVWRGSIGLWHQRMLQRGYSVLMVDGRGSRGKGRAHVRQVHGRLGELETIDQTAAARWLAKQPEVDPKRIGIWGWSSGGTLALFCLQTSPDVFAAGASIAPVTDWRDYDTTYTERYLGLPKTNAPAYDRSSPITTATSLRRPLFIAHGLRDSNVHARGTFAYVDKLQREGIAVEMDFYPRGDHGIGGQTAWELMFGKIERFFDRELGVK
ncbi:MAG: DPP IV N-terminal domain-containing protein [Planctomycetota bacterium]